jgi:hypothetical protein
MERLKEGCCHNLFGPRFMGCNLAHHIRFRPFLHILRGAMSEDEAVLGWLKRIGTNQTEFVATLAFPIEDADKLYKFFRGFLQPGDDRWFAVAAIDHEKATEYGLSRKGKKKDAIDTDAQKAIKGSSALCKKEPFWRWLREEKGEESVYDEESALVMVKKLTGVKSRHDYINNVFGREQWFRLSSEYHKWAAQPDESVNPLAVANSIASDASSLHDWADKPEDG